MNCPENREELLAAYIDRRLPETERHRFEEHLSRCPYCLSELMMARTELDELSNILPGALETIPSGARKRDQSAPIGRISDGLAGLRHPALLSNLGIVSSLAVFTAVVLGLGFFELVASDNWDPDMIRGRSQLGRILDASMLGEMRLTGGKSRPDDETLIVRGTPPAKHGLFAGAETSLRKAMTRYPDNLDVYTMLGHLYMASGHVERAQNYYARVHCEQPDDAASLNNLAVARYRMDDTAGSMEYLEAALRTGNPPPEVLYNLAVVNSSAGHTEEAGRYAESYLSKDATSGWAARIKTLVGRPDQRR